MTGSGFATMFVVVLLIHVSIIVYTWIEKRCKPILVKLDLFESEVETLHAIAAEYLQSPPPGSAARRTFARPGL